jgi:hypothetical protein
MLGIQTHVYYHTFLKGENFFLLMQIYMTTKPVQLLHMRCLGFNSQQKEQSFSFP